MGRTACTEPHCLYKGAFTFTFYGYAYSFAKFLITFHGVHSNDVIYPAR